MRLVVTLTPHRVQQAGLVEVHEDKLNQSAPSWAVFLSPRETLQAMKLRVFLMTVVAISFLSSTRGTTSSGESSICTVELI